MEENKEQSADGPPTTAEESQTASGPPTTTVGDVQSPSTTIPTDTPQEVPTDSLKPPSNKKKIIGVVGIVFLLLAALGAAGYFYFQNQQLKKEVVTQPTSTPLPAEVSTKEGDPTADWAEYVNTKFGIKLKYPQDWFSQSCSDQNLILDPTVEPICETEPYNAIIIVVNDDIRSVDKIVEGWLPQFKYTRKDSSQEVIGNFKYAVEKVQPAPGPDNMVVIYIPLANGKLIFYINDTQYEKIADQILSTFEFKDNQEKPTADWETYTFNSIGLTFSAPRKLVVKGDDQPNPDTGFVLYVQNYPYNSPIPNNYYQLYIIYQWVPPHTESELEELKNDLVSSSITETTVAGYPAIQGQIVGERNRFVTHFIKDSGLFSAYTVEPTKENGVLTNQILSTFQFTE